MKSYLQLRIECICYQINLAFEILEDSEEFQYKPVERKKTLDSFVDTDPILFHFF